MSVETFVFLLFFRLGGRKTDAANGRWIVTSWCMCVLCTRMGRKHSSTLFFPPGPGPGPRRAFLTFMSSVQSSTHPCREGGSSVVHMSSWILLPTDYAFSQRM